MNPPVRCLTLLAALAFLLPGANAQEEPAVEVVELSLHPAMPPRAALEHRLLPSYLNMTRGNAAPLYSKAALALSQTNSHEELWNNVCQWLESPPDELPREQVRETLAKFSGALEQIEIASRRTHCHWELPIWEADNPYEILLPELQGCRNLARLVALKVRLAIAEGDLAEAVHWLQNGFALGRHVADHSTLIGGLVGIAISGMMADQLEGLIQLPHAPNLYWSITSLPTPLVDLRGALELESVAVYLLLPQFASVKTKKYAPGQWEALFDEEETIAKLAALLGTAQDDGSHRKEEVKLFYHKILTEGLPTLKRELIQRGHAQEELERMPASQVVVLHTAETFDEMRDDVFKWFPLPYWQAHQGIEAARARLIGGAGPKTPGAALAQVVLPALGACHARQTWSESHVAALRLVEAIRLYAAAHDGRLPTSLDDVTEVPIPVNPFTGQPFEFRLEGKTALVEAGGVPQGWRIRQYRITLAE